MKPHADMSRISITGAGNRLEKTGLNQYIVNVTAPGTCTIFYTEYGKKIFEKDFKIERLSYPEVTIDGLRDTIISIARILANPFIKIISPGSYFRHDIRTISFRADFSREEDSTDRTDSAVIIPTPGSHFSPEQIKWIKQLKKNDAIILKESEQSSRMAALSPFLHSGSG